jgi:hypothetical protein
MHEAWKQSPCIIKPWYWMEMDGNFHTSDIIIFQKGSPEFISPIQQYFIFMTECSVA